jgi:hypothetical protein
MGTFWLEFFESTAAGSGLEHVVARFSAYGLQAWWASQYIQNGDPMASVELSTSRTSPFIDDHLQAFPRHVNVILTILRGKVWPQANLTVDGPCVNRDLMQKCCGFWNALWRPSCKKWGTSCWRSRAHRVALVCDHAPPANDVITT